VTSNNGHRDGDSSGVPPRLPSPLVTWGVVVVLAVVGVVALVIAIRSADVGQDEASADPAVERLVPGEGDQEPRQTRVGVDLVETWTVDRLSIDGVEIPQDQWTVNAPLGQVFFEPGPGKELELLEAGDVCAEAAIHNLLDEEERRVVSWCFRAI
jgi:hypothetical protein